MSENDSFDSSGVPRAGPKKSILKNKMNSSNNSDSGSASSASQVASSRGRLPSRVPPTGISQQYQPLAATPAQPPGPQPHKTVSPAYRESSAHVAKPAPYNQPFDDFSDHSAAAYTSPTQPAVHPAAARQQPISTQQPPPPAQSRVQPGSQSGPSTMAGFHPAFAQLGPSVLNKPAPGVSVNVSTVYTCTRLTS